MGTVCCGDALDISTSAWWKQCCKTVLQSRLKDRHILVNVWREIKSRALAPSYRNRRKSGSTPPPSPTAPCLSLPGGICRLAFVTGLDLTKLVSSTF